MARNQWDDAQNHLYAQDIAPQTPASVNRLYAALDATDPNRRERILMWILKKRRPQTYSHTRVAYEHTAETQGRAIALGDLELIMDTYLRPVHSEH